MKLTYEYSVCHTKFTAWKKAQWSQLVKSSLKVVHEAIRIFCQGVALPASVKYPEQHFIKATLEYFSDLA